MPSFLFLPQVSLPHNDILQHQNHGARLNKRCGTDTDTDDDKPQKLRYNFFHFGFGVRKCLGQHDAEILVKAFVFELLQQYEMSLDVQDTDSKSKGKDEGDHLDGGQESWVPLANRDVKLEARI